MIFFTQYVYKYFMLRLKCRDGIGPLIETWDEFWVREVRSTRYLDTSGGSLVYVRKNLDRRQLYVKDGEYYKKSFVCEKDL